MLPAAAPSVGLKRASAPVQFPNARFPTAQPQSRCASRLGPLLAVKAKNWFMPKPTVPLEIADTWVTQEARNTLFGVSPEQVEPVQAKISGTIPEWLRGSLIYNGGGDYSVMNHMFDGYAILSKTEIKDGKVFGSQRYLNSQAYQAFKATGKVQKMEFATMPQWKGPWDQLKYVLNNALQVATNNIDLTDNAAVTLSNMPDGSLLALSEVKTAGYRVDPATLETLEQVVLFNDGSPDTIRTAHWKPLPDGTFVGFTTNMPFGKYIVFKWDPRTPAKRQILAEIPHREFTPAWMHDFGLSDKYAILVEPPLFFSFASLVAGFNNAPVGGCMNWKPSAGTRVYVVPLDGSQKVRSYYAPAFFYFHFANAFEREDGQYLYVDFNVQEDAERVNGLYKEVLTKFPGQDSPNAYLRRLSIPLNFTPTGNALQDMLIPPQPVVDDEESYGFQAEFPAFNPSMQGKRNRYAYACCIQRPCDMNNALTKLDLQERRTEAVWHVPGCHPAEPMFIAAPNPVSEDDGVLLSPLVLSNGNSGLLVLDAKTFEQLAIAELPYGTGWRFHGTWVPA